MMMVSQINSKLYITSSFVAIGGFLYGYHTGVISGIATMPRFVSKFGDEESIRQEKLSSGINGAIVGCLMFGCVLGALFSGQTSDRLSRKYSISLFSVVSIISAILQAASVGLSMLLIARVIGGVAVGGFSVIVPVYLSEIATENVRGRLVSLHQLGITIGIAMSFWVAYGLNMCLSDSDLAWQISFALQIVPALILGVGIFFCPFSPRWLMMQDREFDASIALRNMRSSSESEVSEEFEWIKIELALERQRASQSYSSLIRGSLLRRLILGIGLQIFQQFTGINSIMYYTSEIFKQTGLSDKKGLLLATGINGCVNVFATIPTVLFIDKIGRRLVLIAGAAVMAVGMLTAGGVMGSCADEKVNQTMRTVTFHNTTASYTFIVFIYVFVAGFAFSWGPTVWVYCTELFPLTLRAKGTSILLAMNWAANCALSFAIPVLLERIWFETYIIFGLVCIIIGISTFLFYPETKGVSLERMDELFSGSIFAFSCSRSVTEFDDINSDESTSLIDQHRI